MNKFFKTLFFIVSLFSMNAFSNGDYYWIGQPFEVCGSDYNEACQNGINWYNSQVGIEPIVSCEQDEPQNAIIDRVKIHRSDGRHYNARAGWYDFLPECYPVDKWFDCKTEHMECKTDPKYACPVGYYHDPDHVGSDSCVAYCKEGQLFTGTSCVEPKDPCSVGNPITLGGGKKTQSIPLYSEALAFPIEFSLVYRNLQGKRFFNQGVYPYGPRSASQPGMVLVSRTEPLDMDPAAYRVYLSENRGVEKIDPAINRQWKHSYQHTLQITGGSLKATLYRANGDIQVFARSDNDIATKFFPNFSTANLNSEGENITQLPSDHGLAPEGYELLLRNGVKEFYSEDGKVVARESKSGHAQRFYYNRYKQLERIENSIGEDILISYDVDAPLARIASVLFPDGLLVRVPEYQGDMIKSIAFD